MKKNITLICSIITILNCSAQKTNLPFKTLVDYMQGSFSSEEQSKTDTNYFHITLDMAQIWEEDSTSAWLYVEQTAAWTPNEPYRQRIYHLELEENGAFKSTILKMPHPEKYIGAHKNPQLLDSLNKDSLEVLPGCALKLQYKDGNFKGSTVEGACKNAWGKASYATSEVSVSEGQMISWDRGWNDKKEQVWGAENGGYIFIKQ